MAGNSLVTIGGDFNQFPDTDLRALGLTSSVNMPLTEDIYLIGFILQALCIQMSKLCGLL